MFDLFRAFSGENKKSKSVAKERLKLVLVNDRASCSPGFLDMIRNDIVQVISNYVEVDESNLELKVTKSRGERDDLVLSALVANIPIRRIKDNSKRKGIL